MKGDGEDSGASAGVSEDAGGGGVGRDPCGVWGLRGVAPAGIYAKRTRHERADAKAVRGAGADSSGAGGGGR